MNEKKLSAEQLQANLLEAAKKIESPCVICIHFYACKMLCKRKQAHNELQAALLPLYPRNSKEKWEG